MLHCAILNNPPKKEKIENISRYLALIKHLVSVLPESLEQKSSEGWTPLQIAVFTHQTEVVSYLISVGANQRSRDKAGRNVVHNMLVQQQKNGLAKTDAEKLQKMIELFDKAAVGEMLLERSSERPGALTPLAYWMSKNDGVYKKPDIVTILSKYSNGEDLEMINGEGDLPLHMVRIFLSDLRLHTNKCIGCEEGT